MGTVSAHVLKNAPRDATHYCPNICAYYRKSLVDSQWMVWDTANELYKYSIFSDQNDRLISLYDGEPDLAWVNDIPEDQVNQPSHYKRKSDPLLREVRAALLEDGEVDDLECIEAMLSHLSTIDQIRGALRANSFKYRWRYEDKDRLRSLKKARWYEDKLEILEEIVDGVQEENF